MNDLERLTRNYRTAFLRYISRRDEAALMTGYQLGRDSVVAGVSVLDLARVHHQILIEALEDTPVDDVAQVATSASDFFLEVLGTFDMAQRGLLSGRPKGSPPGTGQTGH